MNYPQKEGKHGPIYQIAEGVYVAFTQWGTWHVVLKRGQNRKSKAFGKSPEDLQRAIKAAELLALKLGLIEERRTERTFGEVAEEWYNLNLPRWQPATQERYRCIVRSFLQPLHGLPLNQVDRHRVKRLLMELLQIRAPGTVEAVHAVLSGIFSESIDLGYTQQNPAHALLKRVVPPKNKRKQSEPDPFPREDLDRLLEAAWQKLPQPLPLILEVMAMSGMRLGEALAMRWENLDARNQLYHVTETTRQGRFGPPKSGKRMVDLPQGLVAKLEAHLRQRRKAALAAGQLGPYLFPGVSQRMVQTALKRACVAARLRARSPHDLRHTYATLLLMDHYSPAYVQKQLGHHSISMTVDVYGHWLPGEGKKDLERTLRGSKGSRLKVVRVGSSD